MKQETKDLLVGIAKVDLVGGSILSLIIAVIWGNFVSRGFAVGIIIAFLSLFINSILYHGIFFENKSKSITYILIFFKLVLIAAVGLRFINNPYAVIAYVLGYNAHFLNLIIYWIFIKKGSV